MRSTATRLPNTLPLALLICALPFLTGCLESDVTRHMKYNAENDSFEILSVFNHIRAQTAADLDHAGHLYEVRSDLINPIVPIAIFTQPAWIRKSNSEYVETNLGAGTDGTPETKKTEIALESITVEPGKFFLNKNGMPAYYHRIVVPGKALNGLLAEFDKAVNEGIGESVKKERKRRAEGHPVLTWEQVQAELAEESQEKQDVKNTGEFPFNACSADSLSLLAKSAAESKLHLTRDRTRFEITLPLTPTDAKQVAKTVELAKPRILEAAEKENAAERIIAVVKSIRAKAADSGKITLSIDVGDTLSQGVDEPKFAKSDTKHLDNAAVVAGLKERGITFDEKLTHEAVVTEFAE